MSNELYHHGIKGQKWGVRRFQNEDGTLTEEGLKRYRTDEKFKKKYDSYVSRKEFWSSDKGKRVKKGAIITGSVLGTVGALGVIDLVTKRGISSAAGKTVNKGREIVETILENERHKSQIKKDSNRWAKDKDFLDSLVSSENRLHDLKINSIKSRKSYRDKRVDYKLKRF
jgi:hypothetical protein